MLKLLEDRELAGRLGRAGREYVRGHFLLPRLLRDEAALLSSLGSDGLVAAGARR